MGLGLGILLIVLGAVASFTTLDKSLIGANVDTVGWILLAAGALSIVVGLVMNAQRANTTHRTVVEHRDSGATPDGERGDDAD